MTRTLEALWVAILLLGSARGTAQIQEMIDASEPGDTIVLTGEYEEHDIKIKNPITIIGDATVDVDFNGSGFLIESDSVSIEGVTIKNIKISHTEDFAAIHIKESKHFRVSNTTQESVFFGILIEKSEYGVVEDNNITAINQEQHNSGNGIHAWYSKDLLVQNNHLSGLRDGIYFEFVDNSEITGNTSTGNLRYGLHFMFSDNDTYKRNKFSNNGSGTAVMFSKNIKMYSNEFSANWGSHSYGLLLKEVTDSEIYSNTISGNTIGINAEGLNRIKYMDNLFENNGWAVKFRGACYGNELTANRFIGNSFDIAYDGREHDNNFDGNYWSKYVGYDLDKDGMGDTPYRPVSLFSVISNKTPETLVMMNSMFIKLLDYSERIAPVFTPVKLMDNHPIMKIK